MAKNRAQKQRRQAKAEARVARRTTREQKEKTRFVEPLTPKRAMHIAKANANLEYKPIERAIQGEIAGSKKREGEIGKWYGGLDNLIAQQQAAGVASDAAATNAINSQIAQGGAQSAAGLQQIADQNAARATLAGGAASPTLQSTAALGNANLAATRSALNAPTIQAQSSFQKFTGGRRISAAERGIEAHKANAATRKKMMQDKLNARLEKGRAVTSGLSKLRGEERDYRIQNKAFSLNTQEAAEKAKHDAETAAASRQGNRVSAANSKRTAASSAASTAVSAQNAANSAQGNKTAAEEFKYEKKHGTGSVNSKSSSPSSKKGPTQSQAYATKKENQDAFHAARAAYTAAKTQGPVDWAKIEALLGFDYGGTAVAKAVSRLKEQLYDVNGKSLGR